MNSRERMLAAMDHRPVDRVPTDIWATSETWSKLQRYFGEGTDVVEALHIDRMADVDAKYVGPAIPELPEGETVNYWGMRTKRISHEGGAYDEQTFYPLAEAQTARDLDCYAWPTTDWFDYSEMREQAIKARDTHAVQCGYMAPFYYHNLLRGLEQSLMDPYDDPELTHEIVKRISDFFFDHHLAMFETCQGLIDVAQVTDDLGSQTGPLISVDLYREYYAPQHKRFIDLCHRFGIRVMHHDDGAIRPFLPILVEMGIDILNPVQWNCPGMELEGLKDDFGGRVCFHGAIDNQQVLPFGSPDEVRALVRRCIDVLARDRTGYILAPCHNIQVCTPVENIVAMYDEAWSYGNFEA